jgi:subtilisin family serine protease
MAARYSWGRRTALPTEHDNIRLTMMRSIVMEPLASLITIAAAANQSFDVIVWLNESFRGGIDGAAENVFAQTKPFDPDSTILSQYCFARLTAAQILGLAVETRAQIREGGRNSSPIFQIWSDTEVRTTLTRSLVTVKADAAQRAFQALGDGIVWAVLDSGIDASHPHFSEFENLRIPDPLAHTDFTSSSNAPLLDEPGHGTHVAGIIAGRWQSAAPGGEPVIGREMRDESSSDPDVYLDSLTSISGVAPRCKLLSLRVVGSTGSGKVSWVLRAIERVQQWNQYGKRLLVHGANLSLGYDFDPRWFACGQSPLCVEVDRLVRSGVSVVVSAGNGGYSSFLAASGASTGKFSDMSISDPGNAELAITAGSTHREMPHTYGVSYFSSRGPTGDGRLKPDLLAPGERIVSCAAGRERDRYLTRSGADGRVLYCEQSGTSMAAPHVSGAIAAFLSVRPEFIGEPERIKRLFTSNTIDLHRHRYFQGAGLMDLMKVLQSV